MLIHVINSNGIMKIKNNDWKDLFNRSGRLTPIIGSSAERTAVFINSDSMIVLHAALIALRWYIGKIYSIYKRMPFMVIINCRQKFTAAADIIVPDGSKLTNGNHLCHDAIASAMEVFCSGCGFCCSCCSILIIGRCLGGNFDWFDFLLNDTLTRRRCSV